MQPDYLEKNKTAYDELAEEFRQKIEERKFNNDSILRNFTRTLNNRFSKNDANVLEIGPGAGYLCKALTESGYDVTAIEFAPKMAAVCKEIAPQTSLIIEEFLEHNFGNQKFAGILAVAFIHLFPKNEAGTVLEKIRSLLKPNGIVYIGTTASNVSEEGFFPKVNFKKKLLRFRRRFTRKEFEKMMGGGGFRVIHSADYPDHEEENKVWMDYIFEKTI